MPQPELEAKRLCLFGGTFDPIHNAHLRIAEEASRKYRLDRVLFIPAGNPPHKQNIQITPFDDRLAMVELATAPFPSFTASRLEEGAQRSFTVDTVKTVKTQSPPGLELFFLIGADAFDEIESWHQWQELLELITFIVVTRPGDSYRVPAGAQVLGLKGVELPISSSEIRARIRAGDPTPELPAAVRAFIEEHGLYGFVREKLPVSQ